MATNKNITMKQFNGIDYDILYPKDIGAQIFPANNVIELFNLEQGSNADDVFAFIGNRISNVYVWVRRTYQQRTQPEKVRSTSVATTNSQTKYYANAYTFDASTGIFTLTSPTSGTYNSSLRGKWWAFSPTSNVLYYSSSSAFFSDSSIEADEYTVSPIVGEWEYVNNAERNAYPDSGVSGGYEYSYAGNLGNKAQIATGSYVGTGTYGSDHPNSIVCPFVPKFIWVVYRSSANARSSMLSESSTITLIALDDVTTTPKQYFGLINGVSENNCYGYKSDDGKTFFWYQTYTSNYPARYQLNENAYTYRWLAIG